MGLLVPLILGLVGWLIWTGRLQRMSAKDGMAIGAALVGAVMAAKGKPVAGVPIVLGAAFYLVARGKRHNAARRKPKAASKGSHDLARARALLGVEADAGAAEIRSAHRRLIASVHPDRGGTEALAAEINAARDLLLAAQAEQGQSAP